MCLDGGGDGVGSGDGDEATRGSGAARPGWSKASHRDQTYRKASSIMGLPPNPPPPAESTEMENGHLS